MNIAIFASGSGSNAERIIRYFEENNAVHFPLILSSNPNAYVLERAKTLGVPTVVFTRQELNETDKILQVLQQNEIDFIVLAGFLQKIPDNLITAYPNKIINIHPALLPKYGGKGMYGHHIHEAVIANAEAESGITIHYINEHYDEGNIIFQTRCALTPADTPDTLAEKIHQLEYEFYPQIISEIIF
ncbi:MAG: phosphoribosylglycinamide formyltransferase [Prevotellaceae bacterium]|jgi:phosphoribosylglycinamide formyltransferase-1|nr:phosphoribosylglycinamide formyltransferase [Prevotellaceae bacterium]